MLRNVLDAVGAVGTVEHVALVTGLKHYLGPFEAYAQNPAKPPFRESQPRLDYENFYYDQEDILFGPRPTGSGSRWSVHRPHTVIGYALGNAMNMGVTLAVYGTHRARDRAGRSSSRARRSSTTARPTSPTRDCWPAHLAWAATSPAGAQRGVQRRQRRHLPLAADVGGRRLRARRRAGAVPGPPDAAGRADGRRARRSGGGSPSATASSSPTSTGSRPWWHTDSDLGRTVETYADMTKSREAGFTDVQDSRRSFLDLFDRLRDGAGHPHEDGSPT